MEIVLKGSTKVTESLKRFDFPNIVFEEVTPLSNLELKLVYDRVTVQVKVGKISEPTEVPTGKKTSQLSSLTACFFSIRFFIFVHCEGLKPTN